MSKYSPTYPYTRRTVGKDGVIRINRLTYVPLPEDREEMKELAGAKVLVAEMNYRHQLVVYLETDAVTPGRRIGLLQRLSDVRRVAS